MERQGSQTQDDERMLDSLQAQLVARREATSRELHHTAPPVPACDVDFNRLLADRARLVDALQTLARMRSAGAHPRDIAAACCARLSDESS
jgi:hypothetical protein